MKRIFTSITITLMMVSAVMAQGNARGTNDMRAFGLTALNKTEVSNMASAKRNVMPVYYDELISAAPAGQVVSGVQRSGYSYYYGSGTVLGGYNDGFVGEYVIGDDGNIYIKDACASIKLGTYLKLDKIDDENYVAHTAQIIWVDNSGDSPYTAYATRLVFHKYSENSYGYVVETDESGKEVCDVYFTYKNGVLQQKDQEVINFNGVIYPHELIAFTNATGGWIGYGDACLTFAPSNSSVVTLPEGTEVKEGSFMYNTLSSIAGINIKNAQRTQFAEVGNDFYIKNPVDGKNWIKGQIDRAANTVTFLPQYVGVNESIGCHQWFIPATYSDYRDVWDEEENAGSWERTFTKADAYVCKYENGAIVTDDSQKQTMVISLSESALQMSGAYTQFAVKPYEPKLAKPATPIILKFEPVEYTGLWAELTFAMSPVDLDDVYINTEELYYNLYFNTSEKPYTFKASDFSDLTSDVVDVPYLYDDDTEFDCNGAFHTIYFYTPNIDYLGIQAIHKANGQEMRSDIVWYEGKDPTGIRSVDAGSAATSVKMLENNRIVIVKNGVKYNVSGQIIRK